MQSAFHSAVVHVHDFELACENYSLLIGRAPAWRGRLDHDGSPLAIFSLANMHLEIRGVAAGEQEGLGGIRLVVPSIHQQIATGPAGGTPPSAPVSRRATGDSGFEPELAWMERAVDRGMSRQIDVALVDEISGWPEKPVSEGLEDSAASVRALDHVVVLSADVEATRAFYGDLLGLRLALDRSFEKRGVRLLFFRIGGVTIEIGSRLGAEPAPERADRFGGLAWQTPDVRALQTRLLGRGFDVSEVRDGHKPGTFVCTARDRVHGVPTLLIQPVHEASRAGPSDRSRRAPRSAC